MKGRELKGSVATTRHQPEASAGATPSLAASFRTLIFQGQIRWIRCNPFPGRSVTTREYPKLTPSEALSNLVGGYGRVRTLRVYGPNEAAVVRFSGGEVLVYRDVLLTVWRQRAWEVRW